MTEPQPLPQRSEDGAMVALLRANMAGANEKAKDVGMTHLPGLVRGAPTHDLAYLLTALEHDGWRLVRASGSKET